ncbi:AraC family transcriptional regulator [Bradyrhizobium sp. UFLA05-109]
MPGQKGSFGRRMGELCGADEAPYVIARTLRNTSIVATRIAVENPGHEKTPPMGIEDAFIAAITFQEGYYRDNWLDGRQLPYEPPQPAGSVCLMDLRRLNETLFKSAVNSVQLYFPRKTLDVIADSHEIPRMSEFRTPISVLRSEPTIAHLAASLVPGFDRPDEVSQLFLDHVLSAAALHLIVEHGGSAQPRRSRGGLAPWQQRRVEELLEANLNGSLFLNTLAAVCGISASHFSRAFTQSNGMPPHRWLLQRRIEKAKELLLTSRLPLAELALVCGFTDQAHFTRVFKRQVGASPGAWRRRESD